MRIPENADRFEGLPARMPWAAALLIGWLPYQGVCASAGIDSSPRPPEYLQNQSGAQAALAGNPADPDLDVSVGGNGVEVTLAAHGNDIVVGWVDSPTRCAWATSHDGGKTWGPKFNTAPSGSGITGDPALGVDAEGNFYLVCQDYGSSQLRFSKSTDGAKTWTPWKSFQSSPDKPWVAGARNGTVYTTWLGSPGGFKRSIDGGETWEAAKSLGNLSHGTAIGAGNTGLVHILYNYGSPLRYVRSKDWGATLEAGRNIVPDMGQFCFGCDPRQHPIVGGGCDPTGKYVVAVWSAQLANSDGADDIQVTLSRDAGDTWSKPIKVNDNANKSRQFLPWAAMDASGTAHVIWTDMRDGKNSIYYAKIVNDNIPSKNVEITNQTGNVSGWFGDYQGVVVDGNDLLVAWTDTRSGGNRIFFSRGKGLASGGNVAVRDAKAEAARIKAAWTTTTLYDVKGARVEAAGEGRRPAAGKYLPGKAPVR